MISLLFQYFVTTLITTQRHTFSSDYRGKFLSFVVATHFRHGYGKGKRDGPNITSKRYFFLPGQAIFFLWNKRYYTPNVLFLSEKYLSNANFVPKRLDICKPEPKICPSAPQKYTWWQGDQMAKAKKKYHISIYLYSQKIPYQPFWVSS